jgi:hypothetical protein
MLKLAREFGISDKGLARICRKYDIPTPGVGYWARLEKDKKALKQPLPWNTDLDAATIAIDTLSVCRLSQAADKYWVNVRDPIPLTKSLDNIDQLHPVIAEAVEAISSKSGMNPRARALCVNLGLRVDHSHLPRCLMLLNTIFNTMVKRGHKIITIDGHRTVDHGEDVKPVFHVFEVMGEQVGYYICIHLGKIEFRVTTAYHREPERWRDSKTRPLEHKLPSIIKSILSAASLCKRRSIEVRAARRREEERQRREAVRKQREQEEERLRDKERGRIDQLESLAARWRKARELREFLKAYEDAVIKKYGGYDKNSEFDEWLVWATHYTEYRTQGVPRQCVQFIASLPATSTAVFCRNYCREMCIGVCRRRTQTSRLSHPPCQIAERRASQGSQEVCANSINVQTDKILLDKSRLLSIILY